LLISGVLVVGAVGCENGVEKTSTEAPNNANETPEAPAAKRLRQTKTTQLAKFVEISSMLTSKPVRSGIISLVAMQ